MSKDEIFTKRSGNIHEVRKPDPGKTYSEQSAKEMEKDKADPSVLPLGRNIICRSKEPIALFFDITASMDTIPLTYLDKIKMFNGQLILSGYTVEPGISCAAIGDAISDRTPLQVCDFVSGDALLDWFRRIWLERRGGPYGMESYELMFWYYMYHVTFVGNRIKPIIIAVVDEAPYLTIKRSLVWKFIGKDQMPEEVDTMEFFQDVRKKFDVHIIIREESTQDDIIELWKKAFGAQAVSVVADERAFVDIALGFVAVKTKTRTLKEYLEDLKNREQTEDRIEVVGAALSNMELKIDTEDILWLGPGKSGREML